MISFLFLLNNVLLCSVNVTVDVIALTVQPHQSLGKNTGEEPSSEATADNTVLVFSAEYPDAQAPLRGVPGFEDLVDPTCGVFKPDDFYEILPNWDSIHQLPSGTEPAKWTWIAYNHMLARPLADTQDPILENVGDVVTYFDGAKTLVYGGPCFRLYHVSNGNHMVCSFVEGQFAEPLCRFSQRDSCRAEVISYCQNIYSEFYCSQHRMPAANVGQEPVPGASTKAANLYGGLRCDHTFSCAEPTEQKSHTYVACEWQGEPNTNVGKCVPNTKGCLPDPPL